ncbi:MAG: ERF family protein [Candidatus Rhabdochlamydia sp.]
MSDNLLPQMSDNCDIVLTKLMKAKQEIGTVKKDSKNPFHKSNYASLNAYIDASEAHLLENGLILVQAGNGSFTQPLIVATLIHPESGQWIKSYLPILNPKLDSQGLGASVTYMRRYSIATLLGLVSEDDDGETASGRGKYDQQKKKTAPVLNPEEDSKNLQKLLDLFEKDDEIIVIEYIRVVMKHFGWTQSECVKKFLEETDLVDKFTRWKSKRNGS